MGKFLKLIGLVIIGSIFVVLYFSNADIIAKDNYKMNGKDQFAYMNYAKKMHDSNYTYVGGRNRMPGYPYILSLIYRDGMDDDVFFEAGKQLSIILSGIVLLLLCIIFWKTFSSAWYALLLTGVTAFSVFVYKASFVQAELLFYFLIFVDFLLLIQLLKQPTWQLGMVAGVMLGITHLFKASVLPMLGLFLLVFVLKEIGLFFKRKSNISAPLNNWKHDILSAVLVILFFLATIFPYISTSKRVFGHYFYNVNSTFYIWYDSWEEVKAGTRAHGDRVGWPDMPSDQLPSFSKYIHKHSIEQIVGRFANGFGGLFQYARGSFGYFKYVVLYTFVLLTSVVLWWRKRGFDFNQFTLALFSGGFFAGYLTLYAWYYPLATGPDSDRFILALYIPFLYIASKMFFAATQNLRWSRHSVSAVLGVILLILIAGDVNLALNAPPVNDYRAAYDYVKENAVSGDEIMSQALVPCYMARLDCDAIVASPGVDVTNLLEGALSIFAKNKKLVNDDISFNKLLLTDTVWFIVNQRDLAHGLPPGLLQQVFSNMQIAYQENNIIVFKSMLEPLPIRESPRYSVTSQWEETPTKLIGYDVSMLDENRVLLTLFWQNPFLVNNRKVFIQLRDPEDNTIVQADHVILAHIPYELRTLIADDGPLFRDQQVLQLPAGTDLTQSKVAVGIYDSTTGERLHLINDHSGEQAVVLSMFPPRQ